MTLLSSWLLRASRIVFMAVACAAPGGAALGTQHLIDAGADWQKVIPRVRPGDEILLLPGEHKQTVLEGLRGTREAPITIRGLDPADPPVFRAPIALLNPQHVILENLVFDRCQSTAIMIGPGASVEQEGESAAIGEVALRGLRISNTGTKPSSRVIELSGLSNISITDCVFDGWSGRAIDIINCRSVTIERCSFTGIEKFNAELAICARGGTRDAIIRDCRFERAGETCAVSLGGRTEVSMLVSGEQSANSAAQVIEASQCRVIHSYFIDQPCPVLMAHADRCAVRNCTIVRPRRWVFALISMHQDPQVAQNKRPTIGSNIIVWTPGALTGLLLLDAANHSSDLVLESNLWWSDESAAARRRMIPTIGAEAWPQIIDINPLLNDQHRPANNEATMFGVAEN